jgi:hypothetical protein
MNMSDEWIQLTPEEDIVKQGGKALYRYCTTTSHFPHHLIWESDDDDKSALPLSNAEAIAFIIHSGLWREVPEVKALVKALGETVGWYEDEELCRQRGIKISIADRMYSAEYAARAALAPFKVDS